MISQKVIDEEKFKSSTAMGGKKRRSPSQCSGGRIRNIACGYKETIMTCFYSVNKEKKKQFERLLFLNSELQFFAYADRETISNPKMRIQSWLVAFEHRQQMKHCFGEKVKDAINMHTHGMNFHLCEHLEEASKQGLSLIELSMEGVERQFTKLNKIASNRHENSLADRFLTQGRIDTLNNNNFYRKRTGECNNSHIKKWMEEHKWEQRAFVVDDEVEALLIKLQKYGYKEKEHWDFSIDNNSDSKIIFFCCSYCINSRQLLKL